MQKIYFLILLFSLSGCDAYLGYLGSTSTPTKKIDVYVSEKAIKQPYEIVGKGYMHNDFPGNISEEAMQEMAVQKAKAVGADAVLFQDYVMITPANIATVVLTDSARNNTVPATSNAGSTVTKGFTILFLKYKSQ